MVTNLVSKLKAAAASDKLAVCSAHSPTQLGPPCRAPPWARGVPTPQVPVFPRNPAKCPVAVVSRQPARWRVTPTVHCLQCLARYLGRESSEVTRWDLSHGPTCRLPARDGVRADPQGGVALVSTFSRARHAEHTCVPETREAGAGIASWRPTSARQAGLRSLVGPCLKIKKAKRAGDEAQ